MNSLMAPSSPVIVHRSPWHSPVPYLFGGLAAMLSLIAFALMILACSYSKHTRDQEGSENSERDLEAGDSKPDNKDEKLPVIFEEKYVVIMAGQAGPTYIATPVSSRVSSFGSCSCQSNSAEESSTSEDEMMEGSENEKEKHVSDDQLHVRTIENHETVDHQ
ncbi:hypothetical protein CTI12_AA201610 [Artemisia annua]|uniref:Uncharacterized protein n=1 Tax=Artemisia annua TaxID=35608 RepID=A0A2U1N8W5_ARTAN|nr:hypothetical protein CTI12_AA201610 [Artemisia annua]